MSRSQATSLYTPGSRLFATGLAWLLLSHGTARACNVPVFRWALERWGAHSYEDCYRLTVFHEGPLGTEERGLVDGLQESAWPKKTVLNLTIETADLAGEVKEPLRRIWKGQQRPTLPWCVLRYPESADIEREVWAGPLSREAVSALADSPLRRQIAERILDGEVAVWVLVESGIREKDEAALKLLAGHLERLEKVLQIPGPSMEFMDRRWGEEDPLERAAPEALKLRVSFSSVRISREDPAEDIFRRMLVRSEKDLEESHGSEPVVFPVFGRGRVLWALVGKGITEENTEEACRYLVGMCSCEVKRQNPGTDLLFLADWDARLARQVMASDPLPQLLLAAAQSPVSADARIATKPASATVESESAEARPGSAPESRAKAALRRNTLIALGVLAAGVAASVLALRRRSSRS